MQKKENRKIKYNATMYMVKEERCFFYDGWLNISITHMGFWA